MTPYRKYTSLYVICRLFQCCGGNQSRIRLERACERGALLFYRRRLEKAVVMDGVGGDTAQK